MNVSFEHIGHLSATFACDGVRTGIPCKLKSNGTVTACADGNEFCGIVESVRGGFAAVQLHGFAEVPYTGSAPALGRQTLAANAAGGIKTNASGRPCLVVSVNPTAQTAIIEL